MQKRSSRKTAGPWSAALASLLCALSCGSPDDAAMTYASFVDDLCEVQMPCCALASRPTAGTACRSFLEALQSQIVFDAASAKTCLADARAARDQQSFCARVPDGFESCQRAMAPRRGDRRLGDACMTDSECASSSRGKVTCTSSLLSNNAGVCQLELIGRAGDSPCVGVATPDGVVRNNDDNNRLPEAFVCAADGDLLCDDASTCVAREQPAPFGDCSPYAVYGCPDDQYCDSDQERCLPRRSLGAACRELAECARGTAYCDFDTGVCTARRADGQRCESAAQCSSIDCEHGVCQPDIGGELKWSLICGGD